MTVSRAGTTEGSPARPVTPGLTQAGVPAGHPGLNSGRRTGRSPRA
jgi:hypothetical protein